VRRRAAAAAAAIAGLVVAAGAGVAWIAIADSGANGRPADWKLVAPERVELAPGVAGVLEVEVVPDGGRTVSRDGPLRLDVKPGEGVVVGGRRRLGLGDAVDPGAAAPKFAVKVTGEKPGAYVIDVGVRFWLCARQSCKPVKGAASVAVDVVAPPMPDAAVAPPDAAAAPPKKKRIPKQ
jgi:hypothetical protein